ncbi:MAG: amidohydrolase family protein [Nitrospinota bacterium]
MADLLIADADYVVTMDKKRRIIRNGAIAVRGGRIHEVGKSKDLKAKYQKAAGRVLSGRAKLVLPGLVEGHIHHTQHLARGVGDTLFIRPWLMHFIYPFESVMTPEEAYVSSLLCQWEMLRSGATTFIEVANYFPRELARATDQTGMRGVFCRSTYDQGQRPFGKLPPKLFTQTTSQALRRAERDFLDWNGVCGGRLRGGFGLRIPTNCTDRLIVGIKKLADRYGALIQSHVASVFEQLTSSLYEYGMSEFERIEKLGAWGPNWLLIHMGWVRPQELGLLKRYDVKVCHCPSCTMHLGYGNFTHGSFPEMLEMGITVCLGSDASPAGGFVDIVKNMYLAANGHRDARMDPSVMTVERVIEMATLGGAKSALWEDEIGSLEKGKKADIVLFDMSGPEWVPRYNPLYNLVHTSNGTNADTAIIEGKVVMEGGKVLGIDEEALLKEAQKCGQAILKRAGLSHLNKLNWPVD